MDVVNLVLYLQQLSLIGQFKGSNLNKSETCSPCQIYQFSPIYGNWLGFSVLRFVLGF